MDLVTLIQSVLVGGSATTVATEVLKSPFIAFIKAESYPRTTAVILSVLASVLIILQQNIAFATLSVVNWISLAVGTLLVAVATYHGVVK